LPWEEAIVRYSGIVIPCSMDIQQAHKMGKLFNGATGNFRSVWNNAQYRHFREQIADNINDVDICVNCTKRDNNIHYCVGG
ncbi:MAG: SPASM domain-containing protein, partial [Candidatus Omnitrophota bacterium]